MLSCVKRQINTSSRTGQVVPQQGHTAARDGWAVWSDAFCFTALCVCLSACVCDLRDGGMDVEKGNEREGERETEARGTSFAFVELT